MILKIFYNILKLHFQYLTAFFLQVCNAGYFYNGVGCIKCTGNTGKTSAGKYGCDTTCDGVRTIPNEDHTACGESSEGKVKLCSYF